MKSFLLILAVIGCASATTYHQSLRRIRSGAKNLRSEIRTLERVLDSSTRGNQQLRDASKSLSEKISSVDDKREALVSAVDEIGDGHDTERKLYDALNQFIDAQRELESAASPMLLALDDSTAASDVRTTLGQVNVRVSSIADQAREITSKFYTRQ